jgi:predicted HicB family RNase H-like nuclease
MVLDIVTFLLQDSIWNQKGIMKPSKEPIKAFPIRWPESFWEAVSIEAKRRRTSLQQLCTEAVSEKLGIPFPAPAESEDAA